MEGLFFSEFTRKILIRASMDRIYSAWTTEAGLCEWFLREVVFTGPDGSRRDRDEPVAKGDNYNWKWHNFEVAENGKILVANGIDQFVFSFAGEGEVSVNLESSGDRTLITLRQSGIPTDDENKLNIHYGCSNGWSFWLVNLKAWLEHGILLNETEYDLRNVPLAGYEYVNI